MTKQIMQLKNTRYLVLLICVHEDNVYLSYCNFRKLEIMKGRCKNKLSFNVLCVGALSLPQALVWPLNPLKCLKYEITVALRR